MKYGATHYDKVTVEINGVPVTFTKVDYYPYVAGNDVDPPEPPMVDWDETFIGEVNIDGLLACSNSFADVLVEELIRFLED